MENDSTVQEVAEMLRTITAIIGITIIEVVMLQNGIDGVITVTCVAAIAGLGGYPISKWLTETVKSMKK